MRIELSAKAQKQLGRLPKSEAQKAVKKLQSLRLDPFSGKKLKGKLAGEHSLRSWPYRIIYTVNANKNLITIEVIQHRQDSYKH